MTKILINGQNLECEIMLNNGDVNINNYIHAINYHKNERYSDIRTTNGVMGRNLISSKPQCDITFQSVDDKDMFLRFIGGERKRFSLEIITDNKSIQISNILIDKLQDISILCNCQSITD